ncbi:MAG: phosphoglucomutase/phosphomannomutase family protein [Thermoanaerobaculia bacterium]
MIKFGTSGWRAIIGDEFTFHNVRKVVKAIYDYLKEEKKDISLLIGYDTRFLSDKFAKESASFLDNLGAKVYLSSRDVPTPVIAYGIRELKLSGGINFTASHNPPEYSGLKFSTSDGAPAPPEVTKKIEEKIKVVKEEDIKATSLHSENIREVDLIPPYFKKMQSTIRFETIQKNPLKIGIDFLYGTTRGYTDVLLKKAKQKIYPLHDFKDAFFGGSTPDCSEANLRELSNLVVEKELNLGVSCDGDGDRFGILDEKGKYVRPNLILSLIAWYLAEERKMKVGLAKTVATTDLLERIARYYNMPFYETPVGFKYLGELFNQGKIHFGGEESAGLSIQDHVPEKDGILACLLVVEMVSNWKTPLSQLVKELYKKFGALYSNRLDLHLNLEEFERAKEKLKKDPEEFGKFKIKNINRTDGLKILLQDGWVLYRTSGTEPVVRIYAEAPSEYLLEEILKEAKNYFIGG